jgi:predicted nucleotidyltransferase
VIGLDEPRETIELGSLEHGLEIDLVTHDAKKFFGLLLRRNGYVLEQLYSPLVVPTSPAHEELRKIARGCITRHHSHHYHGFARTQWELFDKKHPRRIKPLLYVFRVILTGIHLMRSGVIEANPTTLNEEFGLPYIPELIARKMASHERPALNEPDVEFFRREYDRLIAVLEEAAASRLPESASSREALNDLLICCRLGD